MHGFVNRVDELADLDAALSGRDAGSGARHMVVITGTAGVGKTSLALRWSHRVRERFPDGQLYVNLHGYDPGAPVTAIEALGRFLDALGVPARRIPSGEEPRSELFRSSVAEQSMLVVLDNAATVSQVRPLFPGSPRCLVVVTSRSRMSGLVARDGAHRVIVETLSQAESVELLRQVLAGYRSGDDDADLAELARLCARLPLALRIAGERAAARPWMPLSELISDLRDESSLWDALSAEDVDEGDAVRTVFAWSYRALSPEAAHLFRLLGLHPGPEFGIQAASALAGIDPVRARRLLDTLAGTHLLEECGHDRYQFHDLLRAYALDQAQREESDQVRLASLRRLLTWYLHNAAAAARAGSGAYALPVDLEPLADGVTTPTFADSKAAIAWYETERDNLQAAVRAANSSGFHTVAWQIPAVLTMIIMDREPADTWLSVEELAMDAARQAGDRYGEAIMLDNLGIARRQLFDLTQAESHFDAALHAFEHVGDRHGQARAANGLGVVHLFAHRIDDALTSFERALALAVELNHHTYIGFFTRNLGWAMVERDDLKRAEPLLRQSVAALRDAGERLDEAEALVLLATVFRRSGRLAEAGETAAHALAIAGELDGTLFEALALLESGRIDLARREATEALSHLQQASALFWRVGRPDLQAAAWDATSQAYLMLGSVQDATDFARRAVAAYRDRGDRWHLALALANLADACALGERAQEAQEHRREAVRLLAEYQDPAARSNRAAVEAMLTHPSL